MHSVTSDTEFLNTGIAELPLLETCLEGHAGLNSAMNGVLQGSPRKSCHSTFPCLQLPLLQDPTVCLSPKIDNSLKKSTIVSSNLSAVAIAPESPVSNSEKQHAKKCDSVRSSLQKDHLLPFHFSTWHRFHVYQQTRLRPLPKHQQIEARLLLPCAQLAKRSWMSITV